MRKTNKLPKEVNVLGTKYKIFYDSEKNTTQKWLVNCH